MPPSAITENLLQARFRKRSRRKWLSSLPLSPPFNNPPSFWLCSSCPRFFPSLPYFFFYWCRLQILLNQTSTLYRAQTLPCGKATLFSSVWHCFSSAGPEQSAVTKPRTKHILSNASWSQNYIFPMVCHSFLGRQRVFSKRIQRKQTGMKASVHIKQQCCFLLMGCVIYPGSALDIRKHEFPRVSGGCVWPSQMNIDVWLVQVTVQMSMSVQYMRVDLFAFGLWPFYLSFIAPQFTVWQKFCLGLPKAGRWANS